jgi:hypothetical protein
MTKEEMEKTMAFILEQQAQLSVKVDRNTEGIAALLAVAEIQAAEIRDLTESTRDLRESTRALADHQHEADARGRQTDERLNALINIVERHISEGRNGKA